MATTFTLRQRLRYRFDNVFARGAMPVLLLLVLALIVVFVIAALIQTLFSWGPADEKISFLEGFWLSFVRSLDPGTFSGDEGTHFRTIGVAITLLGVVAMAIIIGLVTTGLESRLSSLKQGRSLVVENNHTLILGSSL
ncbi:MAG: potassium transporter TrkA, partial [Actinobacteria bacterium]|nr:potassium transporter TrkA [Actinomycetota bacterium]